MHRRKNLWRSYKTLFPRFTYIVRFAFFRILLDYLKVHLFVFIFSLEGGTFSFLNFRSSLLTSYVSHSVNDSLR